MVEWLRKELRKARTSRWGAYQLWKRILVIPVLCAFKMLFWAGARHQQRASETVSKGENLESDVRITVYLHDAVGRKCKVSLFWSGFDLCFDFLRKLNSISNCSKHFGYEQILFFKHQIFIKELQITYNEVIFSQKFASKEWLHTSNYSIIKFVFCKSFLEFHQLVLMSCPWKFPSKFCTTPRSAEPCGSCFSNSAMFRNFF